MYVALCITSCLWELSYHGIINHFHEASLNVSSIKKAHFESYRPKDFICMRKCHKLFQIILLHWHDIIMIFHFIVYHTIKMIIYFIYFASFSFNSQCRRCVWCQNFYKSKDWLKVKNQDKWKCCMHSWKKSSLIKVLASNGHGSTKTSSAYRILLKPFYLT